MPFEAATFVVAALVHAGILLGGYEHRQAAIAESVIAAVLLTGLGFTGLGGRAARVSGITAQAFALIGTLAGVFFIAIGVGPRTVPDLVYHAGVLSVLA